VAAAGCPVDPAGSAWLEVLGRPVAVVGLGAAAAVAAETVVLERRQGMAGAVQAEKIALVAHKDWGPEVDLGDTASGRFGH
jgi:hypothetical protein